MTENQEIEKWESKAKNNQYCQHDRLPVLLKDALSGKGQGIFLNTRSNVLTYRQVRIIIYRLPILLSLHHSKL